MAIRYRGFCNLPRSTYTEDPLRSCPLLVFLYELGEQLENGRLYSKEWRKDIGLLQSIGGGLEDVG